MTDQEFHDKVLTKLATLEERSKQQGDDIGEIKERLNGNLPVRVFTEVSRLVGALLAGFGGSFMRGGN